MFLRKTIHISYMKVPTWDSISQIATTVYNIFMLKYSHSMISIDSSQQIIFQLTRQVRLKAWFNDPFVSLENDNQGRAASHICGR